MELCRMTGLVWCSWAGQRERTSLAAEERGGFRRELDWVAYDSVGIVFGCNRDSMSL